MNVYLGGSVEKAYIAHATAVEALIRRMRAASPGVDTSLAVQWASIKAQTDPANGALFYLQKAYELVVAGSEPPWMTKEQEKQP